MKKVQEWIKYLQDIQLPSIEEPEPIFLRKSNGIIINDLPSDWNENQVRNVFTLVGDIEFMEIKNSEA